METVLAFFNQYTETMADRYLNRNIIFIVLLAVFAVSCASSQKMLQRGEYDRAINRAADRLQSNPGNSKELDVLKEAFYLANTFDEERIEFLQLEGRDDNWIEIYQIYEQLNRRQNVVRRLPQPVRNQFDFVNYNEKIVDAKSQAANVSYERGLEFLQRGDRQSARQAYQEFYRVQQLYPGFRDVDFKINEAGYIGTNNVLFQVVNNSDKILPEKFEEEMQRIALSDLNTGWLNFNTIEDPDLEYDYYVVLNIKDISITPERLEINRYEESREIEDGETLVHDRRGNVLQDSLGNDVTEPNLVTVSAQVVESVQLKSARVGGSIDFFDLRTDQLVRTNSLAVEALFEHYSAVAIGDQEALSEETAAKVGQQPVAFPPDEALLLDSVNLLKERSRNIIAANRGMLEQ
jgi:tetratricopeptide (TPR) repeat protein